MQRSVARVESNQSRNESSWDDDQRPPPNTQPAALAKSIWEEDQADVAKIDHAQPRETTPLTPWKEETTQPVQPRAPLGHFDSATQSNELHAGEQEAAYRSLDDQQRGAEFKRPAVEATPTHTPWPGRETATGQSEPATKMHRCGNPQRGQESVFELPDQFRRTLLQWQHAKKGPPGGSDVETH